MADTTIPIDSDVRDDLRAEKVGNETYSEVIERLIESNGLKITAEPDNDRIVIGDVGVFVRDSEGYRMAYDHGSHADGYAAFVGRPEGDGVELTGEESTLVFEEA